MHKDSIYNAVDDLIFQEWCVTEQLIKIRPIAQNIGIDLKPNTIIRKVWDILSERQGTIVSRRRIIELTNDPSMTEESMRFHIQNTRKNLRPTIDIKLWTGLGCSVGVEECALLQLQFPILHKLWENWNKKLTIAEIAHLIYGNSTQSSMDAVRYSLGKITPHFRGKPDRYIVYDTKYACLYLTPPHERPLLPLIHYLPPYLELPFQAWLTREEVGIIKETQQDSNTKTTKPKRNKGKFAILQRIFQENRGIIIPHQFLIQSVYPENPERLSQIRDDIAQIQNGMEFRNGISNIVDLGYIYGCSTVITKNPLIVLYILWKNQTSMTMNQISEQMNNLGIPVTDETVPKSIAKLNKLFTGSSQYKIKVKRYANGTPSTYTLERNY